MLTNRMHFRMIFKWTDWNFIWRQQIIWFSNCLCYADQNADCSLSSTKNGLVSRKLASRIAFVYLNSIQAFTIDTQFCLFVHLFISIKWIHLPVIFIGQIEIKSTILIIQIDFNWIRTHLCIFIYSLTLILHFSNETNNKIKRDIIVITKSSIKSMQMGFSFSFSFYCSEVECSKWDHRGID